MRVVRIVALLIATVAATLHGAVDHAPSAFFQKRKRHRSRYTGSIKPGIFSFEAKISVQGFSAFIGGHAQAAQQSKAHIRPIAGSRPGFCQFRERGRQGKAQVLSQQATLTATWSAKNMQLDLSVDCWVVRESCCSHLEIICSVQSKAKLQVRICRCPGSCRVSKISPGSG